MTVSVMTNLSKVMDIFSDILAKTTDAPDEDSYKKAKAKTNGHDKDSASRLYGKKQESYQELYYHPRRDETLSPSEKASKAAWMKQRSEDYFKDKFSQNLKKSLSGQQPIRGNFIPRPNPKKNTTSDDEDKATVLHHGQLVKESPRPVPGTSPRNSDPTVGRGKKAGFTLESETTSPDKSTYVYTMEKASEDNGGLSSDENADRLNEEAFRRQAITRRGFNPKYGEAGSEVYNRSRPPSSTRRKQLQDRFRRQVIEDNQLNMEKARKNNIYAIATAAADGDEDKKEEIVRALKRGKMILKAFGVHVVNWG
jgi:hypothetical protein